MPENKGNLLRTALILLFLAGSYLAVVQANYPSIYFLKAQIAGIASVLLLISGFSMLFITKSRNWDINDEKGSYKSNLRMAQTIIWTALAIYTLNAYFTVIIAVIAYKFGVKLFSQESNNRKAKNSVKTDNKILLLLKAPYILLLVLLMIWIDVFRELSVWHIYSIRLFPLISLIVAITLFLASRFISYKR